MGAKSARIRADQRVVALGLAESRTKAQALILAGSVLDARGQLIEKPGQLVLSEIDLVLKDQSPAYVSRGGLKLEAALDAFGVEVEGRVGLDVGASTGGFTDCLLQRGAKRVYAVDVGYNQLAWSLRNDERVVVHERVNIRTAEPELLPEAVDIVVIDVSFIGLRLVLPKALEFGGSPLHVIALIKPQFEVGKDRVGKGGIVRDDAAREEAVRAIEGFLPSLGLEHVGTIPSPITGAKGNREFLFYGRR
ncbi:MAG: TlyA family RNA methyltransferase [Myxococcota bacterium]